MDSEKDGAYNILIDVEKRTTDAEKKNDRCWSDWRRKSQKNYGFWKRIIAKWNWSLVSEG